MEYSKKQTITDFEQLEVWQYAQKCAVEAYKLPTASLLKVQKI